MIKEVLKVKNLTKYFPVIKKKVLRSEQIGVVHAVDGLNFSINKGETLGVVGESGCGKTTMARVILGLIPKTRGEVYFGEEEVSRVFQTKDRKKILALRKKMQMIFQNPFSSLNPRMLVGNIIAEPFKIHKNASKSERLIQVHRLLHLVGLEDYHAERYPHEFSGGQQQRICIARALALKPDFIVADEPTSSLDISIRAQILNLLKKLQKEFKLSYLYISHDLSSVRYISNNIAVMYLGKIVELANSYDLFESPLHPYTRALISAVPKVNPRTKRKRIVLPGEVPSPVDPPTGCRFHPRCNQAIPICKKEEPELRNVGGRYLACHVL